MIEKQHSFAGDRWFGRDRTFRAIVGQLGRHHLKRVSDSTRKGVSKLRLAAVFAVLIVILSGPQAADAAIDAAQVQRAIDRSDLSATA